METKSKFVYPDKLYARTNDNITLDISYAPQTLEAVEYIRKDAFIEKACEYFRTKKKCVFACIGEDVYHSILNEEEIEDFKKYMKGE